MRNGQRFCGLVQNSHPIIRPLIIAQGVALCILLHTSRATAQEGQDTDSAGTTSSTSSAPGVSSSSSSSSASAQTDLPTLTLGERFRVYRHSIVNPLTLFGAAAGAGIGVWEDEPPEWGEGMAGYGRRFGSGMGRNVANNTLILGIAALDGEDPRYISSEESGLLARSRHAVVSTFVSRREEGSHMPAVSIFVGAFGSAFIANTWYPPSKATNRHALEQGGSKLASTIGFHLLHEFWPDIRAKLHFHQSTAR